VPVNNSAPFRLAAAFSRPAIEEWGAANAGNYPWSRRPGHHPAARCRVPSITVGVLGLHRREVDRGGVEGYGFGHAVVHDAREERTA